MNPQRRFPDVSKPHCPFGLRIAQLASPPDFPAFPQPIIFLALGLVGGIVLASAAALLPEALACVGTYDAVSRGSAEPRQRCGSAPQPRETPRRLISLCQTSHKRYRRFHPSCNCGQDRRASRCKKLTLEPKSRRCEVGRRVAGGSKPRRRMAAGRQSPLWQSCAMIRSRLRGKLMGRSAGPAIRHRFQAAALSFGATLRFEQRTMRRVAVGSFRTWSRRVGS